MKTSLAKLTLLTLLVLTGCGADDTMTEVKTEVRQTVQSAVTTSLEELAISELVYLTPNKESKALNTAFTGQVYLLVPKESLEKAADKQSFTLNDQVMETISEKSEDDFNIRYNGQTYFTIKKVDVNELNELKLNSEWSQPVLLALKN